jgi:hypothetical protein
VSEKAQIAKPMRLRRMNQIPDVYDDAVYPGTLCPKFAAPQ